MTKNEFKETFEQVKGKPAKIKYGKQTFHNVVLTEYNEALGTVKTAMKGELNTRAIKEIIMQPQALEVAKNEVLEKVPKESQINEFIKQVETSKAIKETLLINGYFTLVSKLGSPYYKAVLKGADHSTKKESENEIGKEKPLKWIFEQRKKEPGGADILVDESYIDPQYFRLTLKEKIKIEI